MDAGEVIMFKCAKGFWLKSIFREDAAPVPVDIRQAQKRAVEELEFNLHPVGSNYLYLGREAIVVKHVKYSPTKSVGGGFCAVAIAERKSSIVIDYADNNGVVRRHEIFL